MTLRPYAPSDLDEVLTLFYRSIHEVCQQFYTPEQLDAWSAAARDRQRWQDLLSGSRGHQAFVVEEAGTLAGFATLLLEEELFDHLYVSPDYQRRGVAALLADRLETITRQAGHRRLWTEASLAAKGFFEARGYRVLKEQQVERLGQKLTNFVMEKNL